MKKTYKVIGRSPTFGHKPGETFEREMSSAQESRMVARGSIEVVSPSAQSTPPPAPPAGGGKPAGTTGVGKE